MNIIADTHLLLWALADDPNLPGRARDMIEDGKNNIYYSIISEWEIEIKHLLHPDRLSIGSREFARFCEASGFMLLNLQEKDIDLLRTLHQSHGVPLHKDPFDRMLICQAKSNNFRLLTHDSLLGSYNEPCVLYAK